jgi:hypothetical protein
MLFRIGLRSLGSLLPASARGMLRAMQWGTTFGRSAAGRGSQLDMGSDWYGPGGVGE